MNNYRENHAEYQQQYEAINAPERIYSLLKPAIGNETSLKIVPDHSDEMFLTTLLDVDYERKLLFLKKINNAFGHFMVIDAKSLRVYSQHNGSEVTFTTHLSRYSERNGGFYEIRFPDTAKYCQRRMSHRVHISYALDVRAECYTEDGQKIQGYLRDISSDGLRLQFSEVNPNELKEKALIKNCVINLPDSEQINCTLQIQHKYNHIRSRGCTIGGTFFAMNAEQKKKMEKFIVGLERRLLREVRV